MYATSPPFLKFTLTAFALSSEVRTRSLLTSSVLFAAISSTADAVDVISIPLMLVAVAAPRVGEDKIGAERVLLVRVCVSVSVTNLFSTEPSHDLQYAPLSYHCSALYVITDP